MEKVFLLAINWYIKSCKNLSLHSVYTKIARKSSISVSMLRKLEKSMIRTIMRSMDINYLTKCEELGIIPEFLKFKPPNLVVYDNVEKFYRKVLLEQLKMARVEYNTAKNNNKEMLDIVQKKLSISQYHLLIHSIKDKSIKEKVLDKKLRHKKKLASLWNNQRRSKTPNCIINKSNHELTISESNALMFGLKHSILPKTIDEIIVKASIESQVKHITRNENKTLSYDIMEEIRNSTIKFISEGKKVCSTRKNKAIHKTLKNLSQNKNIKCLRMDKGNGIVLLNTNEYITKMNVILNDTKKFEKLDFDLNDKSYEKAPWFRKEKSIYSYINKYIKPIVDEKVYFTLIPKGSQPGKMYGMAKHHKIDCPLRPVLSAIGTPEYGLCKWLENQLKPLLKSKWIINSNIQFMQCLSNIKPQKADVCRTFDIKSLYTCVPLGETINIVADEVYSNENSSIFTESKITKTVFKNILKTCSQTIFLFNGQVFKQVDGLSMGSPLAPLLANWFVSKLETGLLKENEPKMYTRYVDDIFTVFADEKAANDFQQKLNNLHRDLIFTMESSTSNKLPFLDINVKLEENRVITSIYKKPSNTDVLLNFDSCTPQSWKKNLIRQLLIRNKRLVSEELQNQEIDRIKNLLSRNGYPIKFISNEIENLQKSDDKPNPPKQQYITVPYIKKVSEKFGRNITKSLEAMDINIKVAFRTTKVGNYFSLKDQVNKFYRSCIVYKFQCPGDLDTQYIGETERQLFVRIKEHTKPTNSSSAVFSHIEQCNICQNHTNIFNCFDVIKFCTNRSILLAVEAIMIKKFKPKLNHQLGPDKGSRITLNIFK